MELEKKHGTEQGTIEAAEATEAAEAAGGATLRRNHSALQAELYAPVEAQACAAGGTHT